MTSRDPSPSPVTWPGQIRWQYTTPELWADALVHMLGIVFALVGSAVFLTVKSRLSDTDVAAVSTYLATLVLSTTISAAYNLWPVSRLKWILRRFDHSAIYLLIAGTYTPFMVKLGTWWLLFGMWGVAILGIGLKVFRPGRFDGLSIGLYLALGWSGLVTVKRILADFPPATMWLIGLGGVIYSLGVIFHVWERLRFQNAIWHGFVLTAATTHYAAVWTAVM